MNIIKKAVDMAIKLDDAMNKIYKGENIMKKVKLIVDGKELEVEISEQELKKLEEKAEPKKTGYERVSCDTDYFIVGTDGQIWVECEQHFADDREQYDLANYYSSEIVAENNARADKLMRQLRRFAVEHRETELDWLDGDQDKFFIYYDKDDKYMDFDVNTYHRIFGCIYFNSAETVKLAIDTFHDELVWYFTEYEDSL